MYNIGLKGKRTQTNRIQIQNQTSSTDLPFVTGYCGEGGGLDQGMSSYLYAALATT